VRAKKAISRSLALSFSDNAVTPGFYEQSARKGKSLSPADDLSG